MQEGDCEHPEAAEAFVSRFRIHDHLSEQNRRHRRTTVSSLNHCEVTPVVPTFTAATHFRHSKEREVRRLGRMRASVRQEPIVFSGPVLL